MSITMTYRRDLERDIDKIRFYIRDTIRNAGPLPENENFADDELEQIIVAEGNWQRGVAACYEALAAAWATHPTYSADGYTVSMSHIQRGFERSAKTWRDRHGGTAGLNATHTTASLQPTRFDGNSEL